MGRKADMVHHMNRVVALAPAAGLDDEVDSVDTDILAERAIDSVVAAVSLHSQEAPKDSGYAVALAVCSVVYL